MNSRSDLGREMLEQLKSVLTPEQFASLPKAEPEEQRGRTGPRLPGGRGGDFGRGRQRDGG
jgi:hypothetical protein